MTAHLAGASAPVPFNPLCVELSMYNPINPVFVSPYIFMGDSPSGMKNAYWWKCGVEVGGPFISMKDATTDFMWYLKESGKLRAGDIVEL